MRFKENGKLFEKALGYFPDLDLQGARAKAASVAELAKTGFDLKGGQIPVARFSLGQTAEEFFERQEHLGYAEATRE